MRSSARTWRAGAKKIQPYAADDFDFLWVHLGVVDLSEHFTRGFFLVPARALRNDTTNRETLVMSVTAEIPPLTSVCTMCDRYTEMDPRRLLRQVPGRRERRGQYEGDEDGAQDSFRGDRGIGR